jgi:type II secretory pathway pseudopilin PulG
MSFFVFKKNKLNLFYSKFNNRGLSLVEALIGIAVFSLVSVGIYQTYYRIFDLIKLAQAKLTAVSLVNEQFEIVRNLAYSDVGILGGLPVGKIPHTRTVNRNGKDYILTTTIRNIDDPFDGKVGGIPNDLSPADYKLAEVEVTCPTCRNFTSSYFTTTVAPKNLEGSSNNGALFVKVFDASGNPITNADVHIENKVYIPNIIIDDVTDNTGILQVIDAPPGVEAYKVIVSKNGYSSEQTYPNGGATNPNPVKPNSTIVARQVTQTSFVIDKTSTINVSSVTEACGPVPDVSFDLSGAKLIGTSPDVKKYSSSFQTNSAGVRAVSGLEWDTYSMSVNAGGAFDLLGVSPAFPLTIAPNATYNIQMVLATADPISYLVSVTDSVSGLPLSGASVRLFNGSGFDSTLITGRGFLRQEDWSLGGGQENFLDDKKKFFDSSNIDYSSAPGGLSLTDLGGQNYSLSGTLTSSTFDTGSASNFYNIEWDPKTQASTTGENSVRFQVATNNDQTNWNFTGPDGTNSTYYTVSDSNIHSSNNGHRYLRYKMFLSTEDASSTPNVSNVAFTFTSDCVSPGQVRFSGLSSGAYDLEVLKVNYNTNSSIVNINANSSKNVSLIPD